MPLDKKAQRILFDTYWSPRGWKRDPSTDAVDFAYARSTGYMFDAIELTHDARAERSGEQSQEGHCQLFRSNASERRILIQCLAYCDVLRFLGRSGFLPAFSSAEHRNRDRPGDGKNDWSIPPFNGGVRTDSTARP
jgi:hypothetical protein